MGRDISVYVEKLTDGQWEEISQDYWKRFVRDDDALDDHESGDGFIYFGQARDRRFWGILEAICGGRGLPPDLSPTVRKHFDESQDFGFSWLLLGELCEFPWKKVSEFEGLVDAANYQKFMSSQPFSTRANWPKHRQPDFGPPGKGWKVVTNDEMARRLTRGTVPQNYYTIISYSQSCEPHAEWVLTDTIPKLQTLGAQDEVRVVFWFSC